MRKSCYSCVMKHLGSAGVFVKETKMGYPDYDIWVIGELEHAADECLEVNPDLAAVIREHRLKWTDDRMHVIPFEELGRYVKVCIAAQESGITTPEVPVEAMSGLETSDDGRLINKHGDTRP